MVLLLKRMWKKYQVLTTERRYDLLKRVYASMRNVNHFNDTSTVFINSLNVAVLYSDEHWMAKLTGICCHAVILVELIDKKYRRRFTVYVWLINTRKAASVNFKKHLIFLSLHLPPPPPPPTPSPLYLSPHITYMQTYSISQEICTRFCCALLCCGYAIVHNEFTWSICPYSPELLCWHWGNR